MVLVNRHILSAVGLGLDAPAFGWPAGVGLRWSLPAATTLRGEGVRFGPEPRGWPDDGFRIYRRDAIDAVRLTCTEFDYTVKAGEAPLTLDGGFTVEWVYDPARGPRLADQLAGGHTCVLYLDEPALYVELFTAHEVAVQADAGARLRAIAYDTEGVAVSSLDETVGAGIPLVLDGPDIDRIDLDLNGATLEGVCAGRVDWTQGANVWGGEIAHVRPLTDVGAIRAALPAERRGEDWETFGDLLRRAVADPDATFEKIGDAPAADGARTKLIQPIADLLLLASLDPVIARLLGLLYWDARAAPDRAHLYTVVAAWAGVIYAWSPPPLRPEPPRPFDLPADFAPQAVVLPPLVSMEDAGPTGRPATAAALRWDTTRSGPPARAVDVAVRYHVSRAAAPLDASADEVDRRFADPGSYRRISGEAVAAVSGGVELDRVRDFGMDEGIYAWSVTGLDAFGRPSLWRRTGAVEIWDTLAPPPPTNVRAAFLDVAALPASPTDPPADPLLNAAHVAWMRANPTSQTALYVGFDWPPNAAAVAPRVREFRLYAQPAAAVPRFVARSTDVAVDASRGQCTVTLDAALHGSPARFVGGTLSDGAASFAVVGAQTGADGARLVVTCRRGPRRFVSRPHPLLGQELIESSDGPPLLSPAVGRQCMVIADTRRAEQWAERLAIVPHVRPLETTVAHIDADGAEPGAAGTRIIDLTLAAPAPHPDPGRDVYLEGGYLVAGSAAVAVLLKTDAARTQPLGGAQLRLRPSDADAAAFRVGQRVTYYPGYAVYVLHNSYRVGGEAVAYGLVTGTSANASRAPQAVDATPWADDPLWREGGAPRRGFESAAAPPATVLDVRRVPPHVARLTGPDLMGWPDASGVSAYTLRWAPTRGVRYMVYRALDDSLFESDRQLRARLGSLYGSDEEGEEGGLLDLTSAARYPDPTRPGTTDYRAFPDADLLRRIASLAGNNEAFTALEAQPAGMEDLTIRRLTLAEGETASPPPGFWWDTRSDDLLYVDRLQGVGRSRYFYRLQSVDAAGNRSALGPSGPPVACRVERLPVAPALTATRVGDLSVTLTWEHAAAGGPDRYAVYVVTEEEHLSALELVRPMTISEPRVRLGATPSEDVMFDYLPPGADAMLLAWGWVGTDLPPSQMWVAVVAENIVPGGATLRSQPVSVRVTPLDLTPPPPPGLRVVRRVGTTVEVEYELARPWYSALVEWRPEGEAAWRTVEGWRPAGSLTAIVFPATSDALELRVRARNADGILSATSMGRLDAGPGA